MKTKTLIAGLSSFTALSVLIYSPNTYASSTTHRKDAVKETTTVQPVSNSEYISQNPENNSVQSVISYSRLRIGGIKLSMSEAQVRRILGKPQRVVNQDSPAIGKIRTLKYREISVDLAEDVNKKDSYSVYKISTKSPKIRTLDGVRVGDNRAKVIKTYGQASEEKNGKVNLLSYQGDLKDSPSAFLFTIDNGKVTEISCMDILN